MELSTHPATRLWTLVREKKSDITAIYFFAIVGGLIQLSLPVGVQAIIGFVMAGSLSTSLIVLITVLVAAVMVSGLLQVNQMKVIESIQQRIFVVYAFAFASRIPRIDLKRADNVYLPELVNRFFDIASLQKGLSKILLEIPAAMIQIFFGLVLLSFYHPFFILFGILLLFLLWLMLYLTGTRGMKSSLAESSHKYAVAAWLEELARMAKTFKTASSSSLHLEKADKSTIEYLEARTRHFNVLLLQYRTLVAFKVAVTAAMLIVGVTLLLEQQINIGQFVAAEIIIITIIHAVEKTIINLDSAYDVLTAVEKVSKLTEKPVEVNGNYSGDPVAGISIEATQLSFGFEPGKKVLTNLSFSIPTGSKVAIQGKDGAGKSTLLKLLMGIYTDFNGSLSINRVPIGNYNLDQLRQKTGIVFSHENIFHGTLWENITMGRENADSSYISELTTQVGLQPYLSSLPKGYDTVLDATGKSLPQHVVRKIQLIRALASRPQLLLLEEPWQGIEDDYRTSIQHLLLQLTDTTVIVVTNDQAFASRCSQTIQL